jgi:hypothetical protein
MPSARCRNPAKIKAQAASLGIFRDSAFCRKCRIRHFRHRLAINTLLKWYQRGVNVEQHLPELSAYLGHTKITDTYWYLTSTPELLRYALHRAERFSRGARP